MKIVIIDSGVYTAHPVLNAYKWEGVSIYRDENGDLKFGQDIEDCVGHGTAIAGIMVNSGIDAEYYIIKVFLDENMTVEPDIIYEALNYIDRSLECDMILMSLGSPYIEDVAELEEVCERLTAKGISILAALDNSGALSYPACLKCVIGVDSGFGCTTDTHFEIIKGDGVVDVRAKAGTQRVCWSSSLYRVVVGTSFAVPRVAIKVAQLRQQGLISKEDILAAMEKEAVNVYKMDYEDEWLTLPPIQCAVLYPFNKEMHTFVRYKNDLQFDIKDVYDERMHGCVGRGSNSILHTNMTEEYKIKNIAAIEYEGWDMMIIGHLDEMSALLGRDLLRERLQECLENKKNVFAFDDLGKYSDIVEAAKQAGLSFSCPSVNKENVPRGRNGRLWQFTKPILGVFGTSSRQGKFTLQLALKYILKKKGYKVKQLGTEPSALLFGDSDVYHMGYGAHLSTRNEEAIMLINEKIHRLELENPDIIIVGCQSATIPMQAYNALQTTLPQWEFLAATTPDCFILCVNPQDDVEYIERTINFLESSSDGRVIALCLYPNHLAQHWLGFGYQSRYLSEEECTKHARRLQAELQMPVFLMNSQGYEALADYVIGAFTEESETA